MGYLEEFQTVDLVIKSSAETRGVDAFALSLIKAERQLRRLVTHLIYQFPCFGLGDIGTLRQTLGESRRVYFEGFERGFDNLYRQTVKELLGSNYDTLRPRISEATEYRNKIFHGQLTNKYLSWDDLFGYVRDIKVWCESLANATNRELSYDGFARNSFQKSKVPELWKRLRVQITNIDGYDRFIRSYMERSS